MEKFKGRAWKLFIYIIPMIVIIIGYLTDWIYFIQSDDYEMNYIAGGGLHGTPDEHLIFIKSVYGYIVKSLYNLIPSVNWFGIGYLIVLLVCIYLILHILQKEIKLCYALMIALTVEIIVLCWLTFTVVAYLCVVTAFLAFSQVGLKKIRGQKVIYSVITAIMFWIAYVFRTDALLSGVALLIPFGIFLLKCVDKRYTIVILVVASIGIITTASVDKITYGSQMWKKYTEYNTLRSKMVDYPIAKYQDNSRMYDELNLSQNDYQCLVNWIFADKEVYSDKVLNQISKSMKTSDKYELNPINILVKMAKIKECWIFLIISVLLTLISDKNKKYQIAQVFFTYAVLVALLVIGRALTRVYVSFFVIGTIAIAYMYLKDKSDCKRRVKNVSIVIIASLIVITTALYFNSLNNFRTDIRNREVQYAQERNYILQNKNKFFTASRLICIMPYRPISKTNEMGKLDNILSTGDWQIYNNTYWDKAKKFNFKYKERLLLNITSDNFLYIEFAIDGKERTELIKKYLEEHTGKKIQMKIVESFEKTGDKVYKFSCEK